MSFSRYLRFALLLLVMLAPASGHTHNTKHGDIMIGHTWARETAPGVTTGAIYMPLMNNGKEADALTGIKADWAERAELHETTNDNGVMKMRKVDKVVLEPGKPVSLHPGGTHIMLIGLKKQLKDGDVLPITVSFEKSGTQEMTIMVTKASGEDEHHH